MSFQKIDKDSPNGITNALDFFTVPSTNTSVQSSAWREYLPLNPITDIPYHFKIHSSSNYLDLSKIFILSEMRIRKFDATTNAWVALERTDSVATINYIGSSFIKNLKIGINDKEVYDSNSLYAYKSWLDTELSLPQSVKNTYLNAAGYYEDSDNPEDSRGEGFVSRKALFLPTRTAESVAQFIARLDADILNQANYMLNNTEIDIEILPNDSNFMVLDPDNSGITFKLEILNLKLYIKTLELMDGLALDIVRKLETVPARYAIRRTSIKAFHINEGIMEYNANLWTEQVPRRIVCGLVASNAYRGSITLSPFKFEPFSVRELTISANSKTYPFSFYNLDYKANKFIRAFHDMHEAIGFVNTSESNGITLNKYKTSHTIYAFNLTNSMEDNPSFDLIKAGSTSINIKFNDEIPMNGATLIVFAEFDSIIFIDKNRNIITDYNV